MLSLFDASSLDRALALPLDAQLRRLLRERVDHLFTLDFGVRDTTYFLVVGSEAAAGDIADELGWSPLVNPLDGSRYGEPAYRPFHDFLADRGGWFEMMVSSSNEAIVVLLIQDDERTDVDLRALCRTYAGEGA